MRETGAKFAKAFLPAEEVRERTPVLLIGTHRRVYAHYGPKLLYHVIVSVSSFFAKSKVSANITMKLIFALASSLPLDLAPQPAGQ